MIDCHIKNNGQAVYLQIADYLAGYIRANQLGSGTRFPSMRSLARANKVSVRTIFRAMEELSLRENMERLPRRGTFLDKTPAALANRSHAAIGIYNICGYDRKHLNDNVAVRMLVSALDLCGELDYQVLQFKYLDAAACNYYHKKLQLLHAVMLLEVGDFNAVIELAREFPAITFILVNFYYPSFDRSPDNVVGVFNAEEEGAYQMTKRMLERYRSIGFVSHDIRDLNYQRRLRGFQRAAEEYGRTRFCPSGIMPTRKFLDENCRRVEDIFELWGGGRVEAIFCVQDNVMFTVNTLLRNSAGPVPQLIGYDNFRSDVRELALQENIPMVTIKFSEMGRLAARIACEGAEQKVNLVMPEIVIPDVSNPSFQQPEIKFRKD